MEVLQVWRLELISLAGAPPGLFGLRNSNGSKKNQIINLRRLVPASQLPPTENS